MKSGGTAMLCLISSLAVCSGADTLVADAANNPYRAIALRNVFNLHDPPPPAAPEANKPPPPKITPLGTTDILGKKLAVFKVNLPASPPNPAKEQTFTMTEGERQGEIEVLEIDTKLGSIKFNNYGNIETKTIEKDGTKPPSSPAQPAMAGAVPPAPNAPAAYPLPTGTPTPATTMPQPGMKTIPMRQLRLPNAGNPTPQPVPNVPAASNLSAEEQALLQEVERARAKGQLPAPPTAPNSVPPQ